MVPPRSTTNSRGSPGGEVMKIGVLKVPTGCRVAAPAPCAIEKRPTRHPAARAIQIRALIRGY